MRCREEEKVEAVVVLEAVVLVVSLLSKENCMNFVRTIG